MKLKQLEGLLGSIQQFSNPKLELEQYPTGPHIASRLVYTAENTFGDVNGKVVADFGCGCGTLGIAGALIGAEYIMGFDVDSQSLETASQNVEFIEVDMDLIQCNVKNLALRGQVIDTVIMNPPFGTRQKGIDVEFLSVALKVASQAVYSLHKTSTREVWFFEHTSIVMADSEMATPRFNRWSSKIIISAKNCAKLHAKLSTPDAHIKRIALRDFNAKSAEVLCELRFDVPKMYKFHKKKEVDIAVDLWRFVP